MNIVQALTMLTQDWCAASDADRGSRSAWITHLVADLHQPLHATTLYAVSAIHPRRSRRPRRQRHSGHRAIAVARRQPARHDCGTARSATNRQYRHWKRWRATTADRPVRKTIRKTIRRAISRSNSQAWAKQSRALAARDAYTPEVRCCGNRSRRCAAAERDDQRRDIALRCRDCAAARSVLQGGARRSVLNDACGREFLGVLHPTKRTEARWRFDYVLVGQRRRAGRHGERLFPGDASARSRRSGVALDSSRTWPARTRCHGVGRWRKQRVSTRAIIDRHRDLRDGTTSSSSGRTNLEIRGVHDTVASMPRRVSRWPSSPRSKRRDFELIHRERTHRATHGVRADARDYQPQKPASRRISRGARAIRCDGGGNGGDGRLEAGSRCCARGRVAVPDRAQPFLRNARRISTARRACSIRLTKCREPTIAALRGSRRRLSTRGIHSIRRSGRGGRQFR